MRVDFDIRKTCLINLYHSVYYCFSNTLKRLLLNGSKRVMKNLKKDRQVAATENFILLISDIKD